MSICLYGRESRELRHSLSFKATGITLRNILAVQSSASSSPWRSRGRAAFAHHFTIPFTTYYLPWRASVRASRNSVSMFLLLFNLVHCSRYGGPGHTKSGIILPCFFQNDLSFLSLEQALISAGGDGLPTRIISCRFFLFHV